MARDLEKLHALLLAKGLTVATAESCTGGLVAAALTSLAGSSAYMRGGAVTYTDEVKAKVLHVPREVLARVGAVSEETAAAMVRGALALYEADCAVATTGFAGPGGGTKTEPVGTVYIAAGNAAGVTVRRFSFAGSREDVRQAATQEAIQLLYTISKETKEAS